MEDHFGMTMRKVTVSLPEDTASGVAAAVEAGAASSFSAFVADATAMVLQRDQALAQLRAHTGGPQGGELRARAARLFGDDPATSSPSAPEVPATGAPDRKAS